MYLIDTNIVSEARRGTPEAVSWLRSVDLSTVYPSVMTLGEIMRGIALKQSIDRRAAASLAEWLHKIQLDHDARILPITDKIALEWRRIAALRPRQRRSSTALSSSRATARTFTTAART